MIRKTSLTEAVAALTSVLAVLQRSASAQTIAAADLTYAVSALQANAAAKVSGAELSADLLNCFTLAVKAGATLSSMLAVLTAAQTPSPLGKPAIAVLAGCQAYAAIAMSRILNATTFTSRDDVDAALLQIGAAFDTVESAAGNALQTDLYRALITLHAATTANLTTQAYPLPRLVTFTMGKTMSALTLAQRLYGDASRAGELAAENQTFNPAFMQMTGRALSA